MTKRVALLRGVNVGGKNKLPIKALASLLEETGATNVATYIQSGNAVFDGDITGAEITSAIQSAFGFAPHVLVINLAAFKKAVHACPFHAAADAAPKSVHLYFFDGPINKGADAALEAIRSDEEAFHIGKGVFYLHSPNGLTASKIAPRVDRLLGITATARNWNTVRALAALAEDAK